MFFSSFGRDTNVPQMSFALDCTARRLNSAEPWPELIGRIHHEIHLPVLADIATLQEAIAATEAGADAVATTLHGFTPETAKEPYFVCKL